jgi:hypothetical protein
MKRCAVLLSSFLLVAVIVGCEGGREVGPPAEGGGQSGITSDFREAMEKTKNKMLKKQMPKDFGGPAKKGS